MDMCSLGLSPSPGRPFVLGEAGTAAGVPDRSLQTLKVCKHSGVFAPVPAQGATRSDSVGGAGPGCRALGIRQPF